MAAASDLTRLSSPRIFLVRMVVFLILVGFVALILNRQIQTAFMANPGLNGLIGGVLAIGIILALRQVTLLFREISWANSLGTSRQTKPPILLAPMATLLGDRTEARAITMVTLRAILDSVATRLDENREILRYMTGLLIFLGLLGTFWGLLETVGSIGGVINSMQTGSDAAVMFDDLKNGLSKPLAGMSISFTSSLFGLAGSLVLGFLDLQAGQAQNRFYRQLEDRLSASTADVLPDAGLPGLPADVRNALDRISATTEIAGSRATSVAIANLAEGIQGLVQHMRSEQQLIRDWVEAQAAQQRDVKRLLERLAAEHERS
ncbi:MAG: MotA/TolQ/ExbB proton channel family protein [Methylobacteriaceae bacterium]|nr:MotA/TolQ/ExbB proton channel family protein [Methylobacteriaceae bacterium]